MTGLFRLPEGLFTGSHLLHEAQAPFEGALFRRPGGDLLGELPQFLLLPPCHRQLTPHPDEVLFQGCDPGG